MKYKGLLMPAIFLMTSFNRDRGAMAPLPPPPLDPQLQYKYPSCTKSNVIDNLHTANAELVLKVGCCCMHLAWDAGALCI